MFGTLHVKEEDLPVELVAKYCETWDTAWLDRIRSAQSCSTTPLRVAVKSTWSRLNLQRPLPEPLHSNGKAWTRGKNVP